MPLARRVLLVLVLPGFIAFGTGGKARVANAGLLPPLVVTCSTFTTRQTCLNGCTPNTLLTPASATGTTPTRSMAIP